MKKKRHSKEWWMKTVRAFEASEMSRADFCGRRGLVVSTLQYWQKRLRRDEKAATFALVQVDAVPTPAPTAPPTPRMVEATLPSGLSLRFEIGTDPKYLSSLLAGLSAC